MTKNPFINALCALAYIVLIGTIINFLNHTQSNKPDTIIAPILALSVFTLSAAVMGYLIVLSPLRLYLDGKKKEGVNLFVQTIAVFAGMTAVILALFISGILQ